MFDDPFKCHKIAIDYFEGGSLDELIAEIKLMSNINDVLLVLKIIMSVQKPYKIKFDPSTSWYIRFCRKIDSEMSVKIYTTIRNWEECPEDISDVLDETFSLLGIDCIRTENNSINRHKCGGF